MKRLSKVEILYSFNQKHSNKYDYGKSIINSTTDIITIICPEHGEFQQRVSSHKRGQGCPTCATLISNDSKKLGLSKLLNMFNEKHSNKYDYSDIKYINKKSNIIIICPEHGKFQQRVDVHLIGRGCKKCYFKTKIISDRLTVTQFRDKMCEIHGDKYNYSKVNYVRHDEDVIIICPKHGEFKQRPDTHLHGGGCSKCTVLISKQETELVSFIESLGVNFETSNREILNGKEIDIYIPSHNIAIEYNGLYWHSEKFIDKNYHLDKTQMCEDKGIQLTHIFEDEWLNKSHIVKSMLRNKLGLSKNKIYGRKTEIKVVKTKDKGLFLDNNHIQGRVGSTVNLGLYYEDELVSIMTFNKPRLGIGSSFDGYELSRFCNKLDTNVLGGASKLLKHFIKTHQPKEIRSYADRVISNGSLYETLGFELSHVNKPNYWYVIGGWRKHRFNFRKELLKKQGFDTENKTEHQIMLERNIYRIYGCGTLSYRLRL